MDGKSLYNLNIGTSTMEKLRCKLDFHSKMFIDIALKLHTTYEGLLI